MLKTAHFVLEKGKSQHLRRIEIIREIATIKSDNQFITIIAPNLHSHTEIL